MRKMREYASRNAHRLRCPEFIARGLPIDSRATEAGLRIVVNERLKNTCMHWFLVSARDVLTLRAATLSPSQRWQALLAERLWLAPMRLRPRPTAECGALRLDFQSILTESTCIR